MRTIQQKEYDLLAALLSQVGISLDSVRLSPDLLVEELQDGNMGSLRFHEGTDMDDDRRLGSPILEGQFHDYDGTLVSLAVNVDDQGRLYEMDMWNIDFLPTRRFPKPEDMEEVRQVCDS